MGIFNRDEKRDELAQLGSEFESLRGADQERLQRYADYREEMEAGRTLDATPRQTEDYGRKSQSNSSITRHRVPLPFAQALTVKHAHRISARLPEVIVDRRAETAEERYRSDSMEKMVWGIIRESRGEAQIASAAWDGSQLGASVFQVYFDVGKQQPCFRGGEPCRLRGSRRPAVAIVVPDGEVDLLDVDACLAQARDHLRVTRIRALVRAEVTDSQRGIGGIRRPRSRNGRETAARAKPVRPLCGVAKSTPQERTSSTSSSARSRSCTRSSCWLVIISLISPSEKNCIPITTSRTPSRRSGR